MGSKTIFASLLGIVLVISLNLVYQIYKMTIIDARARGIKKPRLWGLISAGNRGEGLLLYFIWRKRYPLINQLSEIELIEIKRRKKISGYSLILLVISSIGLILNIFLQ